MTRTDELTAKLLDGTLGDAEWAELESLLATDSAAANAHLALMELEAVLRGERTEFDLTEPTLARVKDAQAEKTTLAVMAEIATHPAPLWAARPKTEHATSLPFRRLMLAGSGLIAIVAAIVVGLWLLTEKPLQPRSEDPAPIPTNTEYARLTQSSGSVEMLTPQGDVLTVTEGREVPPGHTLRTIGEDSLARVEFPDQTTVDIEPDSVVRFVSVSGNSTKPRLFLAAGQLTAAVPDRASARPLVVGTGIADVFGKKGTFVVSSAGPESARVDIKHGNVEVVRMDTLMPVKVAAGSAFFSAGFAKVDTELGLRVDRTPARSLAFPGARDAVFVPSSQPGKYDLWVASPRQFTRWTNDGGTADTPLLPRKDGNVAFTRDHTTLVVGPGAKDDKLLIRSLPGCEARAFIEMKFPDVRFRAVAPGAAWIAIVEAKPNQKWVHLWDGTTGMERFTHEFEDPVGCVASSPDGKTLAVGILDTGRGGNNKIALIDPATGERFTNLPTQKKGLTALTFSNDGRYLAAGFNGLVQVWDVRSRELVKTITGFERVLTCLTFAADGKMLAGSTPEGHVWVWSVASGHAIQLIDVGSRGVRALAFSPDGKRLATVANNAPVSIWDLATIAPDEMQ